MKLEFTNNRLRRQMESEAEMIKAFGDRAKRLKMRLGVLKNAPTLADVPRDPPTRCHPLVGEHAGCFAVDVSGNWRLVFEPLVKEGPAKQGGKLNMAEVTDIRIVGVIDYH